MAAPVVLVVHMKHVDYAASTPQEAVASTLWHEPPLVMTVHADTSAEWVVVKALTSSLVGVVGGAELFLCDSSGVILPDGTTAAGDCAVFTALPPTSTAESWRQRVVTQQPRELPRWDDAASEYPYSYRLPLSADERTTVNVLVLPKPSFECPADHLQAVRSLLHKYQYHATGRDARAEVRAAAAQRKLVDARRDDAATTILAAQKAEDRLRRLRCQGAM
jgi:hypothetical protein